MKLLLLPIVLLQAAILVPVATAGRERVRFDDGWKFHLRDADVQAPARALSAGIPVDGWRWKLTTGPAGEATQVTRPDFDDNGWALVKSAHNLLHGDGTFAWFRATLPKTAGADPRLHFDGVDDLATVYLNGKQLARHGGWQDPFDVALAPAWQESGSNVLTVLVENIDGPGGMDGVYFQGNGPAEPPPVESGPAAIHYDDHAWRDVQLPHDFVVEGTFDPRADAGHGFLPGAAGWYRKTFTLPADDRGKVLWIEFDGVYRNSLVWLNGHLLGQHASGYTSFYYDASGAANYGGGNVLAVWADASQNEGWWYEGGGIYRHVYLTKLDPAHIAHWGTRVSATPSEDFMTATVTVETSTEGGGSVVVIHRILDPDGKPLDVASTDRVGSPGTPGKPATESFVVHDPALWSPDAPRLYTLVTTLVKAPGPIIVTDEERTPFGVRSLRWDANQGFFLNGKPFKIRGTCNHQDFAGLGVALPDRVHEYKVEKLKEMGSNALRCSHQPMAPELLDACDRLGMVVMDENRNLGDTPEILGQVESLVRRDRNHPSVILWSMCNEERLQGTVRGGEMFSAMKKVVRQWDPTRPVSAAMNGGFGGGISLVTDLQGFNYNVGGYDGFHQKFPALPCYGSETASATTTRGIYQVDKPRGYVSSFNTTAENAWAPIAERPWMAGGFIWTGFDYRGEPTPYRWPDINSNFGILDTCGFPKDSYYYYQSEWIDKPAAHIAQQWNRAGQEGQEIPVWVTGNAVKYELFLNGASLGAKDMPAHRHLEWKAPYAPGTLEARGYDAGGKLVAVDKLETTGAPARLELIPDHEQLNADREDVALVRCAVLDAQGRVVPVADNEVTFAVQGPAQVAGVGNGNPSDHDPDKASRRHAFNGHCLVVVQAGDTGGEVTLTARSPGLQSASVSLHAR